MREAVPRPSQLVLPMFAVEGTGIRQPVDALPGVSRLSPDLLVEDARIAHEAGIGGVLLFGVTDQKDPLASSAHADDGVVQQAVRALKAALPDLVVITDVCLCAYTDHGHCGVLDHDGEVIAALGDVSADARPSEVEASADEPCGPGDALRVVEDLRPLRLPAEVEPARRGIPEGGRLGDGVREQLLVRLETEVPCEGGRLRGVDRRRVGNPQVVAHLRKTTRYASRACVMPAASRRMPPQTMPHRSSTVSSTIA